MTSSDSAPDPFANTSEQLRTEFSQRNFAFLQVMEKPVDAPQSAIAMCRDERDALLAAFAVSKRRHTQSWFAKMLDISPSYLSEIKAGKKPLLDWMIEPLSALTGTNIISQYRELQRAMRIVREQESESSFIERIARETQRSAA